MILTITWEVDGTTFPPHTTPFTNDWRERVSHIYLCPHCGTVWARQTVHPCTHWIALHFSCSQCIGYSLPPGTLTSLGDDIVSPAALPLALLTRELLLLYNWRKQHGHPRG